MTTRLFALMAVCGLALLLAACSSVSGFVSDNWPHWAGGMPSDVPPRPGTPGYQEFIAHKPQASEPTTPAATPAVQTVAAPAQPAATAATAVAPRQNPPPAAPADVNAGSGGLY